MKLFQVEHFWLFSQVDSTHKCKINVKSPLHKILLFTIHVKYKDHDIEFTIHHTH